MENSKPTATPIKKTNNNDTTLINTKYSYQETVGSILYLSTKRSDLWYAVGCANCFVEKQERK